MKKFMTVASLALLLGACGGSQPPTGENTITATPAPAPMKPANDQPAQPPPPQSAEQPFAAKLQTVLAGSWRSDKNKARDEYRHPKQTLEFFGLKPGMSLIEITPAGGWYAEILAPLLKGSGSYTAAIITPKKKQGEAAENMDALHKLFAADPAEFGDAKVEEFDTHAPNFGPPNSADMVVTFRNVHNWVMGGTAPAMFKAFYDVLKPGGVLGVVDHRAAPGADVDKIKDSGYLPEDYVVKLATDAGFRLDAKSEINANPKDDRNHEKGVWTLPPTLALGDKDRDKYLAIGESDRMTLRFVKPDGDNAAAAADKDAGKN